MRKSRRSGAANASTRPPGEVLLPDLDARAGRVGGAQVAFGAPGPRIDLNRVLDSWRDGTTVEGSAAGAEAHADPRPGVSGDNATHRPVGQDRAVVTAAVRTVSLSDGTTISFTVAGASLAVDP